MPRFKRADYIMENGKLPAYAFPGGYPLYYLAADSGILCPDCANSDECKAADNDPTEKQWHIVAADINYEDNAMYCDDCNARIESAYAEDEPALCEVIVGNIGTVYTGHDEDEARATFDKYKEIVDNDAGHRAYQENVTLFVDNEIADEYHPEPPEPTDDDIVISDARRGGYNAFQSGKQIATHTDFDDLLQIVRDYMDEQKFWPSVWQERERGGFDLIDPKTGDFIQ